MKKLIVMLLIASFAAFGTYAYANEVPTRTKSDSTMTKKTTKKTKMASKKWKSSKETKSSKAMKMREKKNAHAKGDSTMSHKMKSKSMKKE